MDEFLPAEQIQSRILVLRGQRVLLDSDLASLYGVSTKRLNQQVKRNIAKFPEDFCFQLNDVEAVQVMNSRLQNVTLKHGQILTNRSQFATSSLGCPNLEQVKNSRSQIATLKRGQNVKYLPYAFTEHGAIQAANVIKSSQATMMSVEVVRAFVRLRQLTDPDAPEHGRKIGYHRD